MRLRSRPLPLILLLIPSLVAALASEQTIHNEPRAVAADISVAEIAKRQDVGTKGAPVDGRDGMPHQGPFVDRNHNTDDLVKDLPPLEGRPDDPTIVDGKRIPETNDGVMNDRDRQKPKEGTIGTEGGVSEKDKARKAGDNVPEAPKTPSPSDQDRPEHEHEHGTADEVAGLGKPADLPKSLDDIPPPVPDSANKDHLDVSKSHPKGSSALEEEDEGIIQPFHSFVLSLTMILVSEVGDKTFLVAALMAMKHDRLVVFSAAFGALLVMTVLSAVLGHAVPTLIPKRLTSFAAAGLFFVFGAKLLREGMAMDPNEGVTEELHEVERELAEKEKESAAAGRRRGNSHSVSPYALEMGLGDGDHRKSRSKSRFPSPPRSPSSSRSRSRSGGRYASAANFFQGLGNLSSLLLSPAWVQTFVMTFLGEWGDRSQIATIAMAAGQDYWWVTLGAMTGHCVCTGVAVIGGRAIAGKVSLKVVTIGGALAFLLFGFIYFIEALYA
ncbi:hypothetical protein D7B24_005039 [Verticillium nonalfalfae]|uniref:Transmembrane protein 165 n=1 Tax=Verticillium nonalfalfae TaxID=1051616 RepID=A0A3M9YLM3_9PEZI|nr:uncharacterized protein D7B24_005039 [Verticillium nonalfalfae]RNJ60951.1 hypothetical protein D7B24_005039 [Verticillium nonalfalfae]